MAEFDLDLGTIESEIDTSDRRLVLGKLDGETPEQTWIEEVEAGNILVLGIIGELHIVAADLTNSVSEIGGSIVHFRDMLIITPPGIPIDRSHLTEADQA